MLKQDGLLAEPAKPLLDRQTFDLMPKRLRKPVAAICHGPWTLIDAGIAKGRRMTSWPTLQNDLRNAGADWSDEQVVVDGDLVTSRKPDDIPAFDQALLERLTHSVPRRVQ